jgi:hypothetical protein
MCTSLLAKYLIHVPCWHIRYGTETDAEFSWPSCLVGKRNTGDCNARCSTCPPLLAGATLKQCSAIFNFQTSELMCSEVSFRQNVTSTSRTNLPLINTQHSQSNSAHCNCITLDTQQSQSNSAHCNCITLDKQHS